MTAAENPHPAGANGVAVASPTKGMTEAEKVAYLQCHLSAYAERARPDLVLTAEDIGDLSQMLRFRALRSAHLLSIIRYCREHPRSDTAPALLALIHYMSDNAKGVCWLTYRTMMILLGRTSMETINKGIEKLEAGGYIRVIRMGTAGSAYYPLIPRDLVSLDPQPATLVTALSCPTPKLPAPAAASTESTHGPLDVPDEVEQAIAAWNRAAAIHGWTGWDPGFLNARRRRLVTAALRQIGGIEPFEQALAAIPGNDFMMGRVKPPDGQKPFVLRMEYLLRNEGEELARLLEASAHTAAKSAANGRAPGPPSDLDDRSGRLHAALATQVGEDVYLAWFRTVRVEPPDGDRLTVSVTTKLVRDRIDQQYREQMIAAAHAAFGGVRRVDVVVRTGTP